MKRTFVAALAALLLGGCADEPTAPPMAADEARISQSGTATRVLHVPGDYATVQAAVDAAGEGDLIQVHAGTYPENVLITTPGLRLRASAGVVLDGTGRAGIGVRVLGGSMATPIPDVEISGFEIRGFEQGIVLQWATSARVHRNLLHGNLDLVEPFAFYEGAGIDLIGTRSSQIGQNVINGNGNGGIFLRVGSQGNEIQANRIHENGIQTAGTTLTGSGITVTGADTRDNRIVANRVEANYGRGIMISRPLGTAPITGNQVLQNKVHHNWRSGIAVMDAATETYVAQNDARWNNLSGLAPCYQCNLVDLSIGGNVWERNLGTSNLTDACMP